MRGAFLACLACAGLAACAAMPPGPDITSVRFAPATQARGVARSNLDLSQDFLELTFALESGEKLDHLLRYEAPVRIYLASPELAPYRPDVAELIHRLRAEAGLDVAETADPEAAQIRLQMVPAEEISDIFPTAACFIVPGETDWQGFLRRRGDARRALVRPGEARPGGDLPAERHHAPGRARLPGRGGHPGARSRQRPLPPAGFDLERRQLPRHGDILRHADPARALPAGAAQRHEPGGGGEAPAAPLRPGEPQGPRPAAPAAPARVQGLGHRDRGRPLTRRPALEAGGRRGARDPDRRRDAPRRPPARRLAPDPRPPQPPARSRRRRRASSPRPTISS